jgi:branched-chain amino acid transport system permease protein
LNFWLVSKTDLSKLVLGGFIVLIVVAFPRGIVGVLETFRNRRRSDTPKSAPSASAAETAE